MLSTPTIDPALSVPGPLHRLRFVVELVGQRSAPAAQVKPLLDSAWQGPLGQPEVYAMGAQDTSWRRLTANDPTGSYDSIALAWPYLSERGQLTGDSARRLLAAAERYAGQIGRKAMSLPMPEDVDQTVRVLFATRTNFDAGVAIDLRSRTPIAESLIAAEAGAAGLSRGAGVFEWHVPGWPHPLLELAPSDPDLSFTGDPQDSHFELTIGFNIPRSPDPVAVCKAAFELADHLQTQLGLQASSDELLLDEIRKSTILDEVAQVARALVQAGVRPGSIEAWELFD